MSAKVIQDEVEEALRPTFGDKAKAIADLRRKSGQALDECEARFKRECPSLEPIGEMEQILENCANQDWEFPELVKQIKYDVKEQTYGKPLALEVKHLKDDVKNYKAATNAIWKRLSAIENGLREYHTGAEVKKLVQETTAQENALLASK